MDRHPFLVPVLLNSINFLDVQIDSGCDCYGAINDRVAQRLGLELIPLKSRRAVRTAVEVRRRGATRIIKRETISHMVQVTLDFDGWSSPAAFYVIPGLTRDAILGLPWMEHRKVILEAEKRRIVIGAAGGIIMKESSTRPRKQDIAGVIGSVFAAIVRRKRDKRHFKTQLIATSLREITSILQTTAPRELPPDTTPQEKFRLPPELRGFEDLFDESKASALPPHRGPRDHHIRLKRNQVGDKPDLPWGPLYHMPRDQLLEVRRQVTELMDKGWIRASSSSAAAPVLLAKKPGGGWRFCVDYRALNKITEQDRYPLPLIKETLRSLSGARWLTKLDVRAAFHRIRVAEGDEHLTAFRTRFGLFEWLVCPFGLAGAPATFQRYINGALGWTLDDFTTAYLDDVLVYTGGSRRDHMAKVRTTLERLREAGLHLDPKKCEFAVKQVKYLGYIVVAGKEIRPDPEKVAAIRDWEAPTRVRGVRSFLGFANFYRGFIENFAQLAEPLQRLTRANVPFRWGKEEKLAFQTLKDAFISYPILAQWEPELETIVEADCSGDALGGCLSQWDERGILRPVAYHSSRLTPAERNYTIHDKELLAIISCLKAWSAELKGVPRPFTILTDHKNLEYFLRPNEISERQARWAETLSAFNYMLQYRPGSQAQRPDALSRRGQDREGRKPRVAQILNPVSISMVHQTSRAPNRSQRRRLGIGSGRGQDRKRRKPRVAQVLNPVSISALRQTSHAPEIRGNPQSAPTGSTLFTDSHLQELWDEAIRNDPTYKLRLDAIREGERRFPKTAETREQVADCSIDAHGALQFRGRLWIPKWEPLTTTITQRVHDSPMSGHPGRNNTFQLLQREYHWDGMSQTVKRFVRNCHCYGCHKSRQRRQGLLQPLPIPDRYWKQISMDFMVDLPAKEEDDPRYLMVITDRLSKFVQLEAMTSMTAEACAERFKTCWWRFHGFPKEIITDRGSDWLSQFWTSLCSAVGIEQLLSTSHHPQTDGSTERANQEVQAILRTSVSFSQFDWSDKLAACQLSINNRTSTTTDFSPNRLLHGFDVELVQRVPTDEASRTSPKGRAALFLEHLREGQDIAQAAIAYTQQRQRESTETSRRPAELYRVGDKVWLTLRHIKTNRPSRKLDWVAAKYTVIDVPTPLTVTLDVPRGLHPTFHVDLIERSPEDPLPSQVLQDTRPDPEWVPSDNDESLSEEWKVEEILAAKNARGAGKRRNILVKWVGWQIPTWEPLENFTNSKALDNYEAKWGNILLHDGPRAARSRGIPSKRKQANATTRPKPRPN